MSETRKINHLYKRAGFGIPINELAAKQNKSYDELAKSLIDDSKSFTSLSLPSDSYVDADYEKRKKLSRDERQELRKRNRENIRKINTEWLEKMSTDKAVLREKMTFFWHGHFACKSPVSRFNEQQNNLLRKHALGNFREMVMDVSKDPAMLQFLNNQQNRKKSPNENFARELLELFTIGRGNYSEDDIKNAAKCFTGWGYNSEGEYVFREKQHDFGDKSFMGKTGNFSGEDIINMVLNNRKTAEFIAGKIYKFFVNDNIDSEIVKELADNFYSSNYDIGKLMYEIFSSDWFYDEKNIGAKIKSPVELLAGMSKVYNIKFENPKSVLYMERAMGQTLLNPPNVGGWASGKNWIDTSSMMFRMKLPEIIFKSSNLDFEIKEDAEDLIENDVKIKNANKKLNKSVKTTINLQPYVSFFSGKSNKDVIDNLTEFMLQVDIPQKTKDLVLKYADDSSAENFVESSIERIMSIPEFQLC